MLDMGEPVRILDLARDLIRLSGLEEGVDVDITFSGRIEALIRRALTEPDNVNILRAQLHALLA